MTQLLAPTVGNSIIPFGTEGSPINASDIILPAISIRQNSYRKDFMKAFKPGAMILRPDNTLLSDLEKSVAFVPVSIEKMYRICDITKGEARTIGYESAFEDKPFTEQRGDMAVRRDKCFVAHLLFREDLNAQAEMFKRLEKGDVVDPSDFTLPCRVVFTRSSFNAGKVLNTHFEMSRTIKQSPALITFELKSIESKNEKGNWFSLDVQKAKDQKVKYTPKEFVACCDFWVNAMSKATQFKSHEDEDDAAVTVEVQASAVAEQRF